MTCQVFFQIWKDGLWSWSFLSITCIFVICHFWNIWVGLWISCYICTDANSLQIQSRFRVLFSKSISNDRWSFSMTHNKHIKRQFLPFISVRQGVGFLLLLLWIMANILRFFRNRFFIYIFLYKLLLHGRIRGKKCHQIILNVYGDIRQFSFVINTFFI